MSISDDKMKDVGGVGVKDDGDGDEDGDVDEEGDNEERPFIV